MAVDTKELRALLAKMTPGEWVAAPYGSMVGAPIVASPSGRPVAKVTYFNLGPEFDNHNRESAANAAGIVALVNAAPALLASAARAAELEAEVAKLSSIVRAWHYLAVGPDEMGDYFTHKQLVKISEPYASPALKALEQKQ